VAGPTKLKTGFDSVMVQREKNTGLVQLWLAAPGDKNSGMRLRHGQPEGTKSNSERLGKCITSQKWEGNEKQERWRALRKSEMKKLQGGNEFC